MLTQGRFFVAPFTGLTVVDPLELFGVVLEDELPLPDPLVPGVLGFVLLGLVLLVELPVEGLLVPAEGLVVLPLADGSHGMVAPLGVVVCGTGTVVAGGVAVRGAGVLVWPCWVDV